MTERCCWMRVGIVDAPGVCISLLYTFKHLSWYCSKNSNGSGVLLGVGANLSPRFKTSLSSSVRGLLERSRISGILLLFGLLGVFLSGSMESEYDGQWVTSSNLASLLGVGARAFVRPGAVAGCWSCRAVLLSADPRSGSCWAVPRFRPQEVSAVP